MKKIKVVFAGVGGYGDVNLSSIINYADTDCYEIVGIVDPFVKNAAKYNWIVEKQIPCYDTIEAFYKEKTAELAIISTPIPMHKIQAITAMQNGSNVLCEKPLVSTLQDLDELEAIQRQTGRMLGVGFQWSFCQPILDLKKDILSGLFGKPQCLKTLVAWPRYDEYYLGSTWKGRALDKNSNYILDCITTNATAHYLHNICFIMGDKLSSAAMPQNVSASVYRGKDIETYDTCFIKGEFSNGCEFSYIVTHSGEENINPIFEYKFENAVVSLDETTGSSDIIATFKDGSTKVYGNPQSNKSASQKLTSMLLATAENDDRLVTCVAETVRPHLKICNAIFDKVSIENFPKELCYRSEGKAGSFVKNLSKDCKACYDEFKMPYEIGFSWAVLDTPLELSSYSKFTGEKL